VKTRAVLGDDPEHVTIEPVADRGRAASAAAPSGGFQQREGAWGDPEAQGQPYRVVEQVFL
jgi:hypothetical protein